MNKINKIILRCKNFLNDWFYFNFVIAFSNFIWPLLSYIPKRFALDLMASKHETVKKILYSNYHEIFKKYENLDTRFNKNSELPIWVCWLQGEEKMPSIPKICLNNLRKNSNGHQVNVITFENYSEYVSIPNYIIDKVKTNKITFVHFTDILRICLLFERGGLWIDSTVLVTNKIPDKIFNYPFYSIKTEKWGHFISECRWTLFFMASGSKDICFFGLLRELLFEYWKKEDRIIDYFLLDYFIVLSYEKIIDCRKMIDQIPYNNPEVNKLESIMNDEFNPIEFSNVLNTTTFHKLTFKRKYKSDFGSEKFTYFGYIQNHF